MYWNKLIHDITILPKLNILATLSGLQIHVDFSKTSLPAKADSIYYCPWRVEAQN